MKKLILLCLVPLLALGMAAGSASAAGEGETVPRERAAQMLFDTADRASADPGDCTFSDVDLASPCAEAVAWAQQNGYLLGYGGGLFGPGDAMTVEQAMTMIYRFFGEPPADTSVLDNIRGAGQLSDWARNAAAWMMANDMPAYPDALSPRSAISEAELQYILGQIVVAY